MLFGRNTNFEDFGLKCIPLIWRTIILISPLPFIKNTLQVFLISKKLNFIGKIIHHHYKVKEFDVRPRLHKLQYRSLAMADSPWDQRKICKIKSTSFQELKILQKPNRV